MIAWIENYVGEGVWLHEESHSPHVRQEAETE
jgi:hypothetical protein